jgi:hypothetical protein
MPCSLSRAKRQRALKSPNTRATHKGPNGVSHYFPAMRAAQRTHATPALEPLAQIPGALALRYSDGRAVPAALA